MTVLEQLQYLNNILLEEMPQYNYISKNFKQDEISQRALLRSLMNIRPPIPLQEDFLNLQDEFLSNERKEKGIVNVTDLQPINVKSDFILWQGDITRLNSDAIVNAANCALLGCFHPRHGCIDNAIHSAAGLQLRDECNKIMTAQGYNEPTGQAKITKAYNLPSKYVIHTVGPIIYEIPTQEDCENLASCYHSCLKLAGEYNLKSIAFCCISTGEYRFPNRKAAEVAIETVQTYLNESNNKIKVIFNVFKEIDYEIYRELLSTN